MLAERPGQPRFDAVDINCRQIGPWVMKSGGAVAGWHPSSAASILLQTDHHFIARLGAPYRNNGPASRCRNSNWWSGALIDMILLVVTRFTVFAVKRLFVLCRSVWPYTNSIRCTYFVGRSLQHPWTFETSPIVTRLTLSPRTNANLNKCKHFTCDSSGVHDRSNLTDRRSTPATEHSFVFLDQAVVADLASLCARTKPSHVCHPRSYLPSASLQLLWEIYEYHINILLLATILPSFPSISRCSPSLPWPPRLTQGPGVGQIKRVKAVLDHPPRNTRPPGTWQTTTAPSRVTRPSPAAACPTTLTPVVYLAPCLCPSSFFLHFIYFSVFPHSMIYFKSYLFHLAWLKRTYF